MRRSPKTVAASLGMEEGTLETRINARHHLFSADATSPLYESSTKTHKQSGLFPSAHNGTHMGRAFLSH